ncbi:hypothetical protein ACLB9X_34200 [Streptomyces sp. 5K101]|uniref:hypothetical protein n=1 Tax=Streptomyces sp. 5K101 TaxID=3390037 RepID=UPI00397538CA
MGALPAHLERMRSHPDIAGEVLRLQYTAMSLNPNAKLYGRKTLLEMFDRSRRGTARAWRRSSASSRCRGRSTTYAGCSCCPTPGSGAR